MCRLSFCSMVLGVLVAVQPQEPLALVQTIPLPRVEGRIDHLVYDTATGNRVASTDAVGDTDDLLYDSQRRRLYVTGVDGAIDVFDVGAPPQLTRIAHVVSAPGARTSLFVPEQSRLYLAVPHRGSQQAEIRVYQAK